MYKSTVKNYETIFRNNNFNYWTLMNSRVNRMSMTTIEDFQFNCTFQSTDNTEYSMKTFNITRIIFTSSFFCTIMWFDKWYTLVVFSLIYLHQDSKTLIIIDDIMSKMNISNNYKVFRILDNKNSIVMNEHKLVIQILIT